jgi:isoquinoline 1-oxidoreductase subunit beta
LRSSISTVQAAQNPAPQPNFVPCSPRTSRSTHVRAQVEGGLLFGLSAAAWGEVVLGDGGEILTQNFDRDPIIRMRSVPQIDVHLIDSTESPTGIGEVAVPSVAPALANAIAALTGTRIRRLPFSKTIKIA